MLSKLSHCSVSNMQSQHENYLLFIWQQMNKSSVDKFLTFLKLVATNKPLIFLKKMKYTCYKLNCNYIPIVKEITTVSWRYNLNH